METSLSSLIAKNEESLVDRAATSLKVMFGVGYADTAQEDLEERLFSFFDALVEITRQDAPDADSIKRVVESVMVTPVVDGWSNRAITEEVLQVVDMVVNNLIQSQLATPEQADDKKISQDLLALVIRTAKDVVNGQARRFMAEKQRRLGRWAITGNESEGTVPEVSTP